MAPDSSATKHARSLAARIGTKTFQLQPSVGAYGKGHAEHVNLGHIFFDASARALFINDEKIEQVFWNDVCDVVAWVSPKSSVLQGRLSFINDCREAIGTITYRTGESVIVTASVAPARGGGAPPAYGLAVMDDAIGTGTLGFDVRLAEPFATVAAVDPSSGGEAPVQIRVTEFKTTREGEAGKWYNFEYAIKGGRVYCFVDDVDISHDVILKHEDNKEVHLIKEKRDLTDKTRNYRFDIVLTRPVAEKDQTFSGTWEQDDKTWTWKGVFGKAYEREAEPAQDAVQMVGSDGLTVTELQTMTSLKSLTAEKNADMAQEEGDRIFANIILHSAPEDILKVLVPEMKALDPSEQKIADLGPEFLKIAGVVNIMHLFKASENVAQDQRDRINGPKCDAFIPACAQFAEPVKDKDWVKEFGWDRVKDKGKLEKLQGEYRNVALACYRLGYRRAVLRFQEFLKNAKEWYGIFANYLLSKYHLTTMAGRAAQNDLHIQHDVYDWHNKLMILHEQAGDIGDAPTLAQVIGGLQGAVGVAGVSGVEWDSEFADRMKKFFEGLDEVEHDTQLGIATNEAAKKELEEYKRLRELFQERDELTWSELGKRLIEGIEGHAKLLGPKVSVVEVADSITEEKITPPASWAKNKLTFLRNAACSAIHLVGMVFLTKALMDGTQSLGLPEQISMLVSLMDATVKTTAAASKLIGWAGRQLMSTALMKGIGEGFRKLLESRALSWITAATTWVKGIADKGIPAVIKGFLARNWGNIAKGIGILFGFFVSVASLAASVFEFIQAWKEGSRINAVFAAEQLFFAAVSTIAFGIEIVASLVDATAVAAIAGTIGIWMAGIGIVVAIIALIYQLTRPHPDPIKDFISKYGPEYGLLN